MLKKVLFSFYFSPEGRFGRQSYWIGTIWLPFLLFMGFGLAIDFVSPRASVSTSTVSPYSQYALFLMVIPIFIWATWCVSVASIKRLHDLNMSGWWLLLGAIPYLGVFILVIIFLLPGSEQENRFGPRSSDPFRALQAT